MRGKVRRAVQRVAKPKPAPACEYVAIPEGSSSLAPVITPGPRMRQVFLILAESVDLFNIVK
jgi:hypothetical protein